MADPAAAPPAAHADPQQQQLEEEEEEAEPALEGGLANAVASRCAVPVAALQLQPPCRHALHCAARMQRLPPAVAAHLEGATADDRRADALYRAAVLGADSGDAQALQPQQQQPTAEASREGPPLKLVCARCEDEYEDPPDAYSAAHVVLLPRWETCCRQHAWRAATRESPGELLALVPRGRASMLWCPACCCGLDWLPGQLPEDDAAAPAAGGEPPAGDCAPAAAPQPPAETGRSWLPSVVRDAALHWPVPPGGEYADALATAEDRSRGVVLLAQLAAEAQLWRRAEIYTIPAQPQRVVRRVFVPPSGLDPAGDGSEWTPRFYHGVLTSPCALPHARLLPRGDEGATCHVVLREHDDDPEASGAPGGAAAAADSVEAGGSAAGSAGAEGEMRGLGRCVFGFALRADPDDGAEALPLHRRLGLLSELPVRYDLQVRAVWLQDDERWADCVVPHTRAARAARAEFEQRGVELPQDAEEQSWYTQDCGALDADTESDEESPGAASAQQGLPAVGADPASEARIGHWVQFFWDAYLLALGIVRAGQIADDAAAGSM